MAKYWVKLWIESIHDKKLAKLEDRYWRRFIECLMLAGMMDQDGLLPSIDEASWLLRVDEDPLKADWDHLVGKGFLMHDKRWGFTVTNFARRQATMDKAEYMRRLRSERWQQQYNPEEDEENDDELDQVNDVLPPSDHSVTNGHTERKKERKKNKEEEERKNGGGYSLTEEIINIFGEDLRYVDRLANVIEKQIKPHGEEKALAMAEDLAGEGMDLMKAIQKMDAELITYRLGGESGGQDSS